ncbi:hypothetical protein HDV05_005457 [Chytridiales sp. JEL 0842]|nr:hypothetical protein HDV05_005457 [Chytridiales sp. JEL 0842]
MESIRIAKVENVQLQKGKKSMVGSLHLLAHHLLFRSSQPEQEIWICYSSICNVDRRFQTSQGLYPIYITCKHFWFLKIFIAKEQDALDVFNSLQKLINISSVELLYAFSYKPPANTSMPRTWHKFDPAVEFARMGLGTKTDAWRLSTINKDFLVSITRAAQPMVGLKQSRSIQDEKLVESIFSTARDAPLALGAGTESSENYKDCKIVFSGIENIHVMRDSLNKIMEGIQTSDSIPSLTAALDKSGWHKHIKMLLDGALMIVHSVHLYNTHVLVHCSDGWDRTAQLCSLSEMCLDPFYRTIEGFMVLIEKEWVSFGHKFKDRLGHLSKTNRDGSDKPSVGAQLQAASKSMQFSLASAAKSFLNKNTDYSISSSSLSRPSHPYQSPYGSYSSSSGSMTPTAGPQGSSESAAPNSVSPREISPVFTQFLDCTYQMWTQFPTHFEFNEKFLLTLNTHLYSCQYGNFIFNNEKERATFTYRPPTSTSAPSSSRGLSLEESSYSIWDYITANREEFLNPLYLTPEARKEQLISKSDGTIMGVSTTGIPGTMSPDGEILYPMNSNLRYWLKLYTGDDEEVDFGEQSNSGVGRQSLSKAASTSSLSNAIEGSSNRLASVSVDSERPLAPPLNDLSDLMRKSTISSVESFSVGDAADETSDAISVRSRLTTSRASLATDSIKSSISAIASTTAKWGITSIDFNPWNASTAATTNASQTTSMSSMTPGRTSNTHTASVQPSASAIVSAGIMDALNADMNRYSSTEDDLPITDNVAIAEVGVRQDTDTGTDLPHPLWTQT